MKLEVEVISETTIKPYSPTPDNLRDYQLSFLDLISPPVYNPLVIFYKNDGEIENVDRSNQLKKSLSEVLSRYYPLAGRLRNDIYIDCNDEGIPYVETQVKCNLSDVIEDPIPGELGKLVPFQLDTANEIVLGVQFNIFDCGGIAIGICLSHKVADALSFFTFIKAWAAAAREESQDIICPQFGSSKLFPPVELSGFDPTTGITRDNVVTKRFIFYGPKIEDLKAKYAENPSLEGHRPPTRVEALSAFIWSRFMDGAKAESKEKKLYFLIHAVNLRNKTDPPLPESAFGNLYRIAITIPPLDSSEEDYSIVRHIREEIAKVDKNYVNMLQDGNRYLDLLKKSADVFSKREMESFSFTSLCRFPLYEADFGWGKPEWVGSPALTFKNLVVFMDSRSGDAIEAYVHLSKEDMAKLEVDNEFLTYATSKGC